MASAWRSSIAALLLCLLLGPARPASAEVFLSRSEALAWAFPDAESVDAHTYALSDEQVEEVEKRAHARLDSKLVTIHTARRDGQVIGHALIDLNTVRTLPEAFLVVMAPGGQVRRVRMLAFHEPLEYLPGERWMSQFEGVEPGAPLRLKREVHAISGATLSARAVTDGVRRALALHQVLLAPRTALPEAGEGPQVTAGGG